MGQRDLSPNGQAALDLLKSLPPTERKQVLDLATQINNAASATTPAQRAEALSNLRGGIHAARGHGFKKVKAPDGTDAIEVKITRPNGKEVTCLLSEGARGKKHEDLKAYGEEQLKKATLLSHDDFEAVVENLFSEIKNEKVVGGVLQREDAALKRAYDIVTQGVRTNRGSSWVVFSFDERGTVADRSVDADHLFWRGHVITGACALFGAAPAESK